MLPIPGLDPGQVDPSEAAFASGMLAGAGLREISQTLGLSRKRQNAGKGGGAMPSSATMLGGSMGDLDKMMLLARLKEAMGAGMGSPAAAAGSTDSMPPMGLGMPPGMPGPPLGAGPLPPALPMMGPGPAPLGPLPGPLPPALPMPTPGGALPLQLLMKLLSDAGGVV